jgi:hypothetical protein
MDLQVVFAVQREQRDRVTSVSLDPIEGKDEG